MLRILKASLTAASVMLAPPSVVSSEEMTGGVTDYAPGSTGRITAPLARIVDTAKTRGAELRQTLRPLDGAEGAFGDVDFDRLRTRALTDPRVRSLLGIDATGGGTETTERTRYDGATIFLLASFSMPRSSLRQMMTEARSYGVPVIFRGFVNNSVFDTQTALEETFGTLDAATGFSIDPTVFTRFQVTSVPVVLAVSEAIDVCQTPGCRADPVPPHDRVAGNVPLDFALHLIAEEGDTGGDAARKLLRERAGTNAD